MTEGVGIVERYNTTICPFFTILISKILEEKFFLGLFVFDTLGVSLPYIEGITNGESKSINP